MTDQKTPEGWYDDQSTGQQRWWDGGRWTDRTRDGDPNETPDRRSQRLAAREAKQAEKAAHQAAAQAARAVERAEEDKAREEAAFAASPVGRALAAFQNGDAFFQIQILVSELAGAASSFGSSTNRVRDRKPATDLLGRIEAEGWTLEHVGYVFIETGSTSTNRVLATGQGTVTRGQVNGIYLFRRNESSSPL